MSSFLVRDTKIQFSKQFFGWTVASFALIFIQGQQCHAWADHGVATAIALSSIDEMVTTPEVQPESFDSFLKAEQGHLVELLDNEEDWAVKNSESYAPRPEKLRFTGKKQGTDLRLNFLNAIRVNPRVKLELFLQKIPGRKYSGKTLLTTDHISTMAKGLSESGIGFVSIRENDTVPVIDIVATASDEPDYGLDIGLWEGSGTEFGAIYGFGAQPFGNPTLEFSTQAPFHMGFYHESPIVYRFAKFLTRTYPEVRIHQFMSLGRFALAKGHPYWGWRFIGWALHYVQDLTQPYHSTVLPGASTFKMLYLNALDILGVHGPKNRQLQAVTNAHLALENYQNHSLLKALSSPSSGAPVLAALRGKVESSDLHPFSSHYVREVVSKESHEWAARASLVLDGALPQRMVTDPQYVFDVTEANVDVFHELESAPQAAQESMKTLLNNLLSHFGVHTRSYVRAVLESRPKVQY